MFVLIGFVVVFVTVFGGYVLSGGKFDIILHALPHELMVIFGGYTMIGPIASRLGQVLGEEAQMFTVIKATLIC